MTGFAWGVFCLFGMFLFAALGDLVSEEIRGWLDLIPHAILRLAAARLGPELRESIYQEEWLPELIYVLRGAESRPITRLVGGTTFALGLLKSAARLARLARLEHVALGQEATELLSQLRLRSWLVYRADPASIIARVGDDLTVDAMHEMTTSHEDIRDKALRDVGLEVDPESVEIIYTLIESGGLGEVAAG